MSIKKCRIPKTKGGEYDLSSVVFDDLLPLFKKAVNASRNKETKELNTEILRKELKQALAAIGNKYYNNQLPLIEQAIQEAISYFKGPFINFFPSNIMAHVKQSTRKIAEEIDKETYTASEEPGNPAFQGASYFLDLKFGFETSLKEQLKIEVSQGLLSSFIIDRDRTKDRGYIVRSVAEANENVRNYKQQLFDTVIDYIKSVSPKTNLEQTKLFEGKEFIGQFNADVSEIMAGLRAISQNELLKVYNQSKTNPKERKYLEAIKALFILDNFDSFVNLLLGKAITIKPGTKNKLVSGDNYTFSDKGGHIITSWRTDDNITMEAEIGALAQTLVNSTPFFSFGTVATNNNTQYIKFEDFYRIITKIKDLALNETLAKLITGREGWYKLLNKQEQEAIIGKSLRTIITNIRMSPQIYTRVAFTALCNLGENIKNNSNLLKDLGFNEEEQDKLWSIYKGFFDSNDVFSLSYIQSQYDYTTKNYYELMTQTVDSMFSVDYMNYTEQDGIITVKSLKDSDLEKTRWEIQGNILQSNSRNIIKNGFELNHLKPYKAEILYKKDKKGNNTSTISGIIIEPVKGLVITYEPNQDTPFSMDQIVINSLISKEGQIPQELKKFIDSQLNLDLTFDTSYYDALKTVFSYSKGSNVGSMVKTLLELSSKVLFNKYISNVVISDTIAGKTASETVLKRIYNKKEKMPRYNSTLMEIDLLAQEDAVNLRKLAKAKLITTGQAQSASVKDAEGNLLSTQTLSRQLGNTAFQHDEILNTSDRYVPDIRLGEYVSKDGNTYEITNDSTLPVQISDEHIQINQKLIQDKFKGLASDFKLNFLSESEYRTFLIELALIGGDEQNAVLVNKVIRKLGYKRNAASGFSLLKPGFYTGFYTEKEYKGDQNKARTEFTPAEAMHASFLYSFVGGLITKKDILGKEIIGNGNIGLLPSVNSDKNTMGEAIFNLNKNLRETGRTWLDIIKSTDPNDILLLENAICEELKEAYQISLNNIKSDFLELTSWLKEHKEALKVKYGEDFINKIIPIGPLDINPENDFRDINTFAASIGYKTSDLLFEYTKLYNNNNSETIKLIDQTHFINTGSTIKFNNTFKRLLERYKDPNKFHRFMEMKRSELLVSLLNEHFSINLQGDLEDTLEDTPKKYLRDFEWWYNTTNTINSVKMTINGVEVTLWENNIERLYQTAVEKGYTESKETFEADYKKLKKSKYKIGDTRGKMILAKITVGDKVIDIINKDNLKHVQNLLEDRPDFIANPHELFNSKYGLKVELHPMLDKYNTMDYFLTQEYMIAGVGTHANHPGKAKYNTPTVFTDAIIDESNIVLNADVYLNQIDKNEPNYSQLIIQEWERLKTLANQQNKILVTNNTLLQSQVDAEFTKNKRKKFSVLLDTQDLYDIKQQILENDIQEEAARFLAQHKRNVSFTAAMYPFQLNSIAGIPMDYNMAVIDDIKSTVYTITGDYDSHKPFDGATFVNPLVMYWENNSLQENKAGIDKKQFIHFYDYKTGTGGIIKTAGFAVTNNRAKKDLFYRDMAYNMMKRTWKNADNTDHISETGIFTDFLGHPIQQDDIYFEKDGKYYVRYVEEYAGNNEYNIVDIEVDIYGEQVEGAKKIPNTVSVNSNYDVWQLFGGYNSQELVDGILKDSEESLRRTAELANSYGQIKDSVKKEFLNEDGSNINEVVRTADVLYQPMKHSDIHYMPTVGAIKQGGGNINPSSYFYGHHELNFMKVRMTQAGIQLDKEHHADNSVLSLMTQVISAACSRGYTKDQALKLYRALEQLTKLGTKEFRNELGDLIVGDTEAFNDAVSNILLQTILTSKSNDDDMLQILAKDIIREAVSNDQFSFDKKTLSQFDKTIPYSDNSIYNKIVSSLTVALTKSGIKTKMPGILSVLCPTQDIIKFYKIRILNEDGTYTEKRVSLGQLEKHYKVSGDALDEVLTKQQQQEPTLVTKTGSIDYSQIEVGYKYLITYKDGTQKIVHVGGPHNIEKETFLGKRQYIDDEGNSVELDMIVSGYKNLKTDPEIASIQEWIKDGQDLKAYNVKFEGSDGTSYQMYDLDIVQDYFEIKQHKATFNAYADKLKQYGCFTELLTRIKEELNKSYQTNPLYEEDNSILAQEAAILEAYDSITAVEEKKQAYTKELGKLRARKSFNDSYRFLLSLINNLETNGTLITEKGGLFDDKQKAIIKQFNQYVSSMAIKGMNRQLQLTLDGISPTSDKTSVRINGSIVQVNPSSIVRKCYGAIMPKTFKGNFGLDQFDQVEDIKSDPDFFVKKLVEKLYTKVEGYKKHEINSEGKLETLIVNNYHLELKRPDGNHVYIRKGNSRVDNNILILKEEVPIMTITESDGTIYRVDSEQKKMYQLFSINDKVYRDADGNEVIITQDITEYHDEAGKVVDPELWDTRKDGVYNKDTGEKLTPILRDSMRFYLDTMDYLTFNISEYCTDSEFTHILTQALNSVNGDTKNLALRIDREGTNPQSSLRDKRKYVKALNDYSKIVDSSGNIKKGVNESLEKRLRKLGRKMHTSFLQSLNIIAARIPAQSQQSFMPMQIEAFEDPDVNTAYVSTFQFYLQGSDLDIDAVSLQTFDIDRNGLLVGHSPYYSLENQTLRQASENIPFPTGEKTELIKADFNHETFIEKYKDLFGTLIKVRYNLNSGLSITFDTSSVENINKLSELIQEINDNKGILVHQNLDSTNRLTPLAVALSRVYPEEDYAGNGKYKLNNIEEVLQKAFDQHNLYLQKANVNKRQSIIRNYITTQLFNISSDPINLIESQSSVDTMTSTAKDLAKLSPKATVQNHFTPGNVMNKFQSISENMVGKDGIAICATGLKSFFALTELYQQILNQDVNKIKLTNAEKEQLTMGLSNKKEINKVLDEALQAKKNKVLAKKKSLLFNRTIAGKTYIGIANGYSELMMSSHEIGLNENDLNRQYANFTEVGYNYLLDQLWSSDAANEMSALLSLSTDNAKELVLAKINAGISTIGMYLYGLSLGMSFDSIYNIMTSKLAFRLAELTKGDVFNKEQGQIDILGVLRYLRQEPTSQIRSILGRAPVIYISGSQQLNINKYTDDIIEKCLNTVFAEHPDVKAWLKYEKDVKDGKSPKKPDKDNPFSNPIQFMIRNSTRYANSEQKDLITIYDIKSALDSLRPSTLRGESSLEKEEDKAKMTHFKAVINQAIDFIQQYIDDASLLQSRPSYYNIYGRQDLVSDIEKLAMGATEMKEIGKILRLNQEIKTNSADLIKQASNIEEAIIRRIKVLKNKYSASNMDKFKRDFPELTFTQYDKVKAMLEETDPENKYKVDVQKFLTDKVYQEKMIEYYNIIKQSYNPLQVIAEVPHYHGYVESMFIAYKGLKNKSVKFRVLSEYAPKWIKAHGVQGVLQEQVIKNVSNAIDLFLRQEWMKEQGIYIKMPKGSHAFTKSLVKADVLQTEIPIQLGTDVGDANFKLLMEEVLIPKWKRKFPNNKFIQGLKPVVNTNTNRGTVGISYSLPINMLPKSDYERATFNEYMYHFNDLGVDDKYEVSIQDLLYLYSLITNGGKLGPKSLHKIFTNYIERRGVNSYPYSYREFINKKDADSKTFDEIVTFLGPGYSIAPITTINGKGGDLIRQRDVESGNMLILSIPKESKTSLEDDFEGVEGIDQDLFETQEEEIRNLDDSLETSKTANYGRYRLLDIGVIGGKSNPVYFQNAIDVSKKGNVLGLKTIRKGDFKIKLVGNGAVLEIIGLTDEAKSKVEGLMKIAKRNQKIKISKDKGMSVDKDIAITAVLNAIELETKNCQ